MKYHYASRRDDGRWEFVCDDGRGHVWATGYCALGHDHATEKEARACYRQWLLDHKMKLDGLHEGRFEPCAVCGCRTDRYGAVGMWTRSLCDRHRTRPELERIYPEIVEVITA